VRAYRYPALLRTALRRQEAARPHGGKAGCSVVNFFLDDFGQFS